MRVDLSSNKQCMNVMSTRLEEMSDSSGRCLSDVMHYDSRSDNSDKDSLTKFDTNLDLGVLFVNSNHYQTIS